MRHLILYLLILAAVLLPFVFRRAYGIRGLSVVILCVVAVLHFTHLMAVHRLVMEDGIRRLGIAHGNQVPADFKVAVDAVQRLSQEQMWLFAALAAGLVLLALLPFGILKSQARQTPK